MRRLSLYSPFLRQLAQKAKYSSPPLESLSARTIQDVILPVVHASGGKLSVENLESALEWDVWYLTTCGPLQSFVDKHGAQKLTVAGGVVSIRSETGRETTRSQKNDSLEKTDDSRKVEQSTVSTKSDTNTTEQVTVDLSPKSKQRKGNAKLKTKTHSLKTPKTVLASCPTERQIHTTKEASSTLQNHKTVGKGARQKKACGGDARSALVEISDGRKENYKKDGKRHVCVEREKDKKLPRKRKSRVITEADAPVESARLDADSNEKSETITQEISQNEAVMLNPTKKDVPKTKDSSFWSCYAPQVAVNRGISIYEFSLLAKNILNKDREELSAEAKALLKDLSERKFPKSENGLSAINCELLCFSSFSGDEISARSMTYIFQKPVGNILKSAYENVPDNSEGVSVSELRRKLLMNRVCTEEYLDEHLNNILEENPFVLPQKLINKEIRVLRGITSRGHMRPVSPDIAKAVRYLETSLRNMSSRDVRFSSLAHSAKWNSSFKCPILLFLNSHSGVFIVNRKGFVRLKTESSSQNLSSGVSSSVRSSSWDLPQQQNNASNAKPTPKNTETLTESSEALKSSDSELTRSKDISRSLLFRVHSGNGNFVPSPTLVRALSPSPSTLDAVPQHSYEWAMRVTKFITLKKNPTYGTPLEWIQSRMCIFFSQYGSKLSFDSHLCDSSYYPGLYTSLDALYSISRVLTICCTIHRLFLPESSQMNGTEGDMVKLHFSSLPIVYPMIPDTDEGVLVLDICKVLPDFDSKLFIKRYNRYVSESSDGTRLIRVYRMDGSARESVPSVNAYFRKLGEALETQKVHVKELHKYCPWNCSWRSALAPLLCSKKFHVHNRMIRLGETKIPAELIDYLKRASVDQPFRAIPKSEVRRFLRARGMNSTQAEGIFLCLPRIAISWNFMALFPGVSDGKDCSSEVLLKLRFDHSCEEMKQPKRESSDSEKLKPVASDTASSKLPNALETEKEDSKFSPSEINNLWTAFSSLYGRIPDKMHENVSIEKLCGEVENVGHSSSLLLAMSSLPKTVMQETVLRLLRKFSGYVDVQLQEHNVCISRRLGVLLQSSGDNLTLQCLSKTQRALSEGLMPLPVLKKKTEWGSNALENCVPISIFLSSFPNMFRQYPDLSEGMLSFHKNKVSHLDRRAHNIATRASHSSCGPLTELLKVYGSDSIRLHSPGEWCFDVLGVASGAERVKARIWKPFYSVNVGLDCHVPFNLHNNDFWATAKTVPWDVLLDNVPPGDIGITTEHLYNKLHPIFSALSIETLREQISSDESILCHDPHTGNILRSVNENSELRPTVRVTDCRNQISKALQMKPRGMSVHEMKSTISDKRLLGSYSLFNFVVLSGSKFCIEKGAIWDLHPKGKKKANDQGGAPEPRTQTFIGWSGKCHVHLRTAQNTSWPLLRSLFSHSEKTKDETISTVADVKEIILNLIPQATGMSILGLEIRIIQQLSTPANAENSYQRPLPPLRDCLKNIALSHNLSRDSVRKAFEELIDSKRIRTCVLSETELLGSPFVWLFRSDSPDKVFHRILCDAYQHIPRDSKGISIKMLMSRLQESSARGDGEPGLSYQNLLRALNLLNGYIVHLVDYSSDKNSNVAKKFESLYAVRSLDDSLFFTNRLTVRGTCAYWISFIQNNIDPFFQTSVEISPNGSFVRSIESTFKHCSEAWESEPLSKCVPFDIFLSISSPCITFFHKISDSGQGAKATNEFAYVPHHLLVSTVELHRGISFFALCKLFPHLSKIRNFESYVKTYLSDKIQVITTYGGTLFLIPKFIAKFIPPAKEGNGIDCQTLNPQIDFLRQLAQVKSLITVRFNQSKIDSEPAWKRNASSPEINSYLMEIFYLQLAPLLRNAHVVESRELLLEAWKKYENKLGSLPTFLLSLSRGEAAKNTDETNVITEE